jgi:hypothetical protein
VKSSRPRRLRPPRAKSLVGAGGFEPPTFLCQGPYKALTSVLAAQAVFAVSQEFRLIPLGSVGSLTRR